MRVRKTNAAGNGPWSDIEDAAAVRSSATTIDPPFGARVTPGNAKATFTWSAPAHKGGQTITGYRIEVREADETSTFSKTVEVSGAATTSGEVTGLTNGTEYEGLVRALDGAGGSGNPTVWQSFTPKASTRQVSFAQSSYSVAEGASVTLTVNISPALTTASSVTVVTGTSGTTAATSDYSVAGLTGTSLTLPANATTATFTVAAVSDSNTEDPEKIEYVLEAVSNADYVVSGSGDTAVVTISDAQQTQSNVATLSGLTASTSNSATGTFTSLTPSTFAATTTSYVLHGVGGQFRHPREAHADGDQLRRHGEGGRWHEPDGSHQRFGERRHRALSGHERHQGGGYRPRRDHDADLHGDGDAPTAAHHGVRAERHAGGGVRHGSRGRQGAAWRGPGGSGHGGYPRARERHYGATGGPDHTLSKTTLTFAAGDTEKTFPVLATADMLTEGNEIIRLEMVAVASAPTRWGRRTT